MNRHERRAQKARNKKAPPAEYRAVLRAMVQAWLEESGTDKHPEIAALPPGEAADAVMVLIEKGYARMAYDEERGGCFIGLRLEFIMPETGEVVA